MLSFLKLLMELVYPSRCLGCGKLSSSGTSTWCEHCVRSFWYPRMLISSKTTDLDGCYTLTNYTGYMRKYLIQLKFGHRERDFRSFWGLLKKFPWWNSLESFSIAIPIPLSKKIKEERGYNQTDILFQKWMELQGRIYYPDGLVKLRNTYPQSMLSRIGRIKNLKHSFHVNKYINIKGKEILLLDDIYTTGATLKMAAKELKRVGAKRVIGMVIASNAK